MATLSGITNINGDFRVADGDIDILLNVSSMQYATLSYSFGVGTGNHIAEFKSGAIYFTSISGIAGAYTKTLMPLSFVIAGGSIYLNSAKVSMNGNIYMNPQMSAAATSTVLNPYVNFTSSTASTYYPVLAGQSAGSTSNLYKTEQLKVSSAKLYIGSDTTNNYITDLRFSIGTPTIGTFTGDGVRLNYNYAASYGNPMAMSYRTSFNAESYTYMLTIYGTEVSEHGAIMVTDLQSLYYRNGHWWATGNDYLYPTYSYASDSHILAWREGNAGMWGRQTLAVTAFVEPNKTVYIYTNNMSTDMRYVKSSLYFYRGD